MKKKLCARAATLSLALFTSCVTGRELLPTAGANLNSEEGLVVIAGDVESAFAMTVCRDGMQCAGAALSAEKTVAVLATTAGRYCITSIEYETYGGSSGVSISPGSEDAVCFAVVPGAITYFGHVRFATRALGNTSWDRLDWGFAQRSEAIRGQLDVSFPLLKEYKLRSVRLERR